ENAALALVLWILSLCVVLGLFIITRLFPSRSESPDAQEESGWRPDGVRVFFIYWSVFSLLIYAALNEKVPWLMVHQVQPLILLAGIFIGDVLDRLPSPALRRVFIALLVVLAVYEVRTNIHLNMYNNDNPRESIVYTQSSHDVVETVKMVEEGARRLGQEYCPPSPTKAVVCYHEQTTWPYSWYFRNYKYEISNTVPRSEVPFVITVSGLEDQIKVWGKGKYAQKKIDHRVWWPYGQSVLPFSYFTQRNQSQTDAWKALWNYVLYRELWGGLRPGGMQALLYYREPLKDPEERPAVPAGYDEPVKPLIPMTAVGTYGQGEAQFNEPRGLAFAPDGNTMYVLDARNGRIQVFDKNLQFIAMFGGPGTGDGQFSTPEIAKVGNGPNGGIAVGPDGTIYVTDTWYNSQNPPVNGRIVRFKPDGTPLPSILPASNAPFFYPRGVAVSSNGNIFVADTGQNRIVLFDAQGQFVRILGENAFTEPVGITVGPDGLVYVCDVGGQRVVSFTQEGQYVRHWAIMGWNASNELPLPWIEPYIAVDQQGSVYVTDASTNTIHKLYKEGQKVVQAGGKGTGRNQLNAPKGITIDEAGNVYIADSRNYRILKVRLPG
ncbi:MAG: SMP-30/gluconolactonase/LRE family protein, partial [bacterium]|nr:SMP-30/gluconolactonase/LRE family protein [bacterium]